MTGYAVPRRSRRHQPRFPGLDIPTGPPRCHRCENAPAMSSWRLCSACYARVFASRQLEPDRDPARGQGRS
jgi:hypothetical protein